MPKIDFDTLTIKNLKPEPKSIEFFDRGRSHGEGAFGIRISPKNKRTWFIMYKTDSGKIKRFTLGTYPQLSLKEARNLANDTMAGIHKGDDPMQERRDKREAPTVKDLWGKYQQSLSIKKRSKVPSTEYEENRRWVNIISPALGDMKVADVTPVDISSLLNKIAEEAPISANRLHTLLRVMFKVALANGWITIHPMQWLDKPGGSEPARKRVLSDDEIRTLWPFFDKVRPNPRDILKLGLLTAQRPGEIMSMRWENIDLKKAIWRQDNTKNGSSNLVPLSPQSLAILNSRKPQGKTLTGWVFPSAHNRTRGASEGRTKSTKDARRKIKALSNVQDWTAHDLRRTARTIMSRLKIKQHIRERVLNHAQGGVQGVYDQYDYFREKADALDKLGREIDRILGINIKSNIIELKAAVHR